MSMPSGLLVRTLTRTLGLALALSLLPWGGAAAQSPDTQIAAKAASAVDRGLRFLRTTQKPDGSYGGHLGVTALVVTAMARSPRAYREDDGPFMRDAVAFLLKAQRADGAFAQAGGYEMYTTALSIIALKALDSRRHDEAVQRAVAWMKSQQTVEATGYRPDEKFYGGFGYGSSLRPDLSNTQYAIEALRVSGMPANDPVFQRAVRFVQRIQNRTESNDQAGALDDGGFAYYPGFSFAPAGGWTSTGSMTHAGIKSLLFMDVTPADPRVQAAVKWVEKHYTVDENPGLGATGYFYFIDVFAKSLAMAKVATITTADGKKHEWFPELATRLLADQRPDGAWANTRSPRFWEDRPELATAHAVMALTYGLESRKGAPK